MQMKVPIVAEAQRGPVCKGRERKRGSGCVAVRKVDERNESEDDSQALFLFWLVCHGQCGVWKREGREVESGQHGLHRPSKAHIRPIGSTRLVCSTSSVCILERGSRYAMHRPCTAVGGRERGKEGEKGSVNPTKRTSFWAVGADLVVRLLQKILQPLLIVHLHRRCSRLRRAAGRHQGGLGRRAGGGQACVG